MTCQMLKSIKLFGKVNKDSGGIYMTEITSKELELISDALTAEGLIDVDLAATMSKIADEHEQRYNALLGLIGG